MATSPPDRVVAPVAHPPQGSVHFTNIADVPEVHISTRTVAHDQGWSRSLIKSEINGSPDLLMAAFRMEPHHHHAKHAHPNMGEIYFIHEGRCRIEVGDRAEWVSAGSAVYVPRGTAHCIDTGDDAATVLVIFPEGDPKKIGKEFTTPDASARF